MPQEDLPLLERNAELAVIAATGGGARGAGCRLMVEGPAGIGKTRLVRAACDGARARGMAVLTACGRTRTRVPYGVAGDEHDTRSLRRSAVARPAVAGRADSRSAAIR
jgi:hypothetical protein